jgi:replicative DNA helicase
MIVLKHRVKSLKRKNGVEFVVFDYIQMLKHFLFSGRGRVHELDAIAKSMKKMAVDNNIPVLVLSHITYPYKQHEKPTLSDFRDSDAILQEADKVLLVRRPCKNPYDAEYHDKNLAIVDVVKNLSGSTGEVRFDFDEEINRFTDRP